MVSYSSVYTITKRTHAHAQAQTHMYVRRQPHTHTAEIDVGRDQRGPRSTWAEIDVGRDRRGPRSTRAEIDLGRGRRGPRSTWTEIDVDRDRLGLRSTWAEIDEGRDRRAPFELLREGQFGKLLTFLVVFAVDNRHNNSATVMLLATHDTYKRRRHVIPVINRKFRWINQAIFPPRGTTICN